MYIRYIYQYTRQKSVIISHILKYPNMPESQLRMSDISIYCQHSPRRGVEGWVGLLPQGGARSTAAHLTGSTHLEVQLLPGPRLREEGLVVVEVPHHNVHGCGGIKPW